MEISTYKIPKPFDWKTSSQQVMFIALFHAPSWRLDMIHNIHILYNYNNQITSFFLVPICFPWVSKIPHPTSNVSGNKDFASWNSGREACICLGIHRGIQLGEGESSILEASLVGGWTNPLEKYESKWVHLPQFSGWKNKMKPPPSSYTMKIKKLEVHHFLCLE